jgi:hypothetical protein
MLIHDTTSNDILFDPNFGRGLVERDLSAQPMKTLPTQLPLIPRSEWSVRIKEKKQLGSRISDIRRSSGPKGGAIPSLNQGQWGYCWAHSPTMGNMLLRALMGQPYKKLSAFMVAAIIKNGRDEGGWGALALEFIENYGQPTVDLWPENDASLTRKTAAMMADAAKHKVTADWADLDSAVYDRDLSFDQVATLLLSNVPVVGDFNFWGHSVILMDLEEVEPGSFGVRGLNSWSDDWGDLGEFVLQGSRAVPDNAVATLTTKAI